MQPIHPGYGKGKFSIMAVLKGKISRNGWICFGWVKMWICLMEDIRYPNQWHVSWGRQWWWAHGLFGHWNWRGLSSCSSTGNLPRIVDDRYTLWLCQNSYGKSPCLMGKSTISMVIFNSYFDITRGYNLLIISPWIFMVEIIDSRRWTFHTALLVCQSYPDFCWCCCLWLFHPLSSHLFILCACNRNTSNQQNSPKTKVVGSGLGMFNFVLKLSQLIEDHPLTDTLYLHITWKCKPSQPIVDHPLRPFPLRVVNICTNIHYCSSVNQFIY